MTKKQVEINIVARAELEAFRRTAEEASRLNREIRQQQKETEGLFRAARYAAGIQAARLATDGLRVGVALVRGEWQAVDELVERLPLGIGQLSRSLKDLLGDLTGINAQIREVEEGTARADAAARQNEARRRTSEGTVTRVNDVRAGFQLALAPDDFERQRRTAQQQFESVRSDLTARLSEVGAESSLAGQIRTALGEARVVLNKQMADIDKAQSESLRAQVRAEDDRLAAARRAANERVRIEVGLQARLLELQGRGQEAQLLQLSQFAAEERQRATTDAQRSLIDQIYQLEREAIVRGEDAGGAGRAAGSSRLAGAIQASAMFQGVGATFQGTAGMSPAEKATIDTAKNTERALRLNERMAQAMESLHRAISEKGAITHDEIIRALGVPL